MTFHKTQTHDDGTLTGYATCDQRGCKETIDIHKAAPEDIGRAIRSHGWRTKKVYNSHNHWCKDHWRL
jgi:hypothetical protein